MMRKSEIMSKTWIHVQTMFESCRTWFQHEFKAFDMISTLFHFKFFSFHANERQEEKNGDRIHVLYQWQVECGAKA